MKTIRLRSAAWVVFFTLLLSFLPAAGVNAAAKAPAAPKITSAKVKDTSVNLSWSKAARAKKYDVALRSGKKSWGYWKKVKKTTANKKKYTKKNVYKVTKSGKHYKVYRYQYKYTVKKTTTARKWIFKGKYNTTYYFAVRGKNSKTGKWSGVKTVKIGAKPNFEMPLIENMTSAEAKAKLEKLGLKVSVKEDLYEEDSWVWEDYKEGQVIQQNPAAGEKIKSGQTVEIVVVKRAPKEIPVDDYRGENIDDAISALKAKGIPYEIQYKDVFEDEEGRYFDEGEIYSQSGNYIKEGEKLTLTVIRYKKYGNLVIPDTKVKVYGLDSNYRDALGSIYDDSGFKDSYTMSTGKTASYKIVSGGKYITVDSDGVIRAKKETWYWKNGIGTTSKPSDMTGVTVEDSYEFGSAVICVKKDNKVANVIVDVVDYATDYADRHVERIRKKIFTGDMTDEEKAKTATKYVAANYDYNPHYSGYISEVIYGGGDCWANTALIRAILEPEGIECHVHFENGGGMSGHRNLAVKIGEDTLLCDSGYVGKAPRTSSTEVWKKGFHTGSNGNGTVFVDGYDGFNDGTILQIPSEIDGKKVTEIRDESNGHLLMGYRMLSGHTITEVNIPETVTEIDERAFFDSLATLTAIRVAKNNPAYKDVDGILYKADMSKLLYVPTKYKGTLNVESETVSQFAAFSCEDITAVHLGKNVKSLDDRSIWYCNNISKVTVDSENPYLLVKDDVVYSKDLKTLYFVNPCKNNVLQIPEATESIVPYAAAKRNITGVTGGENVKTIGEAAFWSNSKVKEIPDFEKLTDCGAAAFNSIGATGDVTLNMTEIPNDLFGSTDIASVTITNPNATFGTDCFEKTTVIKGHAGSTAETYASENNMKFESID